MMPLDADNAYRVAVRATTDTLWDLLRERIEHPQALAPEVRLLDLVWTSDTRAMRTVHVSGVPMTEAIELDPKRRRVRLKLHEHPLFDGETLYWLGSEAASDGTLELGCAVLWKNRKSGAMVSGLQGTVQQGVLLMKYEAERRCPGFETVVDEREVMFESPEYEQFTLRDLQSGGHLPGWVSEMDSGDDE